jgi:putative flippase GtrA
MVTYQLFKFFSAGVFGAACYVVFSSVLTYFGLRPWISSLLIYIALMPIVYYIQKRFVFNSKIPHFSSLPKYVTTQLFGLALSGFLPYILENIQFSPEFSFVIVVACITLSNYVIQARWVFAEAKKK